MHPQENLRASIDHRQLSAMVQKINALRSALRRRETRCRICHDEVVRLHVDKLLDWRGVPIPVGPGRVHVVTYNDVITVPPRHHKDQTQIRPADELITLSAGSLPQVLNLNAPEHNGPTGWIKHSGGR